MYNTIFIFSKRHLDFIIFISLCNSYNFPLAVQVNAVYVFDVEEEGRWHVDMTSGSGSVGKGDPPQKPDVTVVVNKENFLKVTVFYENV